MDWYRILAFHPNDVDLYNFTFEKFLVNKPCHVGHASKLIGFKKKYETERLELLGDAILQITVTEKLFHQYPSAKPGALSRLRSRLVRNETLIYIIKKMNLIEEMGQLNSKEMNKNINISTLKNYADLFESLIACIYLDRGLDFVKHWIINIYEKFEIQKNALQDDNYIDILQQVTKSQLPVFKSVTVDKKTTVTCQFLNKSYSHSGVYKPGVKQAVAYQILQDLIDGGQLSADIFQFKEN